MKTALKILAALAAVAGIIYVIATYGDKIVAWAKKLVSKCPCHKCNCEGECECGDECTCEGECECACEEAPAEEAPVEEIVVEAAEPVADEADFEA